LAPNDIADTATNAAGKVTDTDVAGTLAKGTSKLPVVGN
jgi:hypothetical protein